MYSIIDVLALVVVRTGDHTIIGEYFLISLCADDLMYTEIVGQIAALTGGESGNKSPLGTEMYVLHD